MDREEIEVYRKVRGILDRVAGDGKYTQTDLVYLQTLYDKGWRACQQAMREVLGVEDV